jgi:hypothetical protein
MTWMIMWNNFSYTNDFKNQRFKKYYMQHDNNFENCYGVVTIAQDSCIKYLSQP